MVVSLNSRLNDCTAAFQASGDSGISTRGIAVGSMALAESDSPLEIVTMRSPRTETEQPYSCFPQVAKIAQWNTGFM